jgi:hypothetical protein
MRALLRLWRGELPLSEAFWTYAVLGGLVVNALTSLALLALIAADRPLAALMAGYGFSVPYNLVALVGVWRSAARHEASRLRADLIRIATLVGMILLSVT